MNTDQCPGASVCCNPSWCKTASKCLHQQPGQQTPSHVAELLALRAALSQINDWCCYASEEDTAARMMALQQIGVLARGALALGPNGPGELPASGGSARPGC